MGSNCCKGDAAGRPIKSRSSIYTRSRAGATLDDRFTVSEEASGVRLTVSSARTGDSGVYTLQANNAVGKDKRRLRLEVSAEETPTGEDPPTFLRRLQDLTVKVGTRTRFLVEIVSSTECKVTWYRNERRLMEAERVALVKDGNFWCADVATVSVDDAGRWTCTAENLGGRASCSAHLNVLVPKAYKRPEFLEELRALLTEQGTVSLECKVVGVPTPVLRWFKDSREIKAGDVFALTANAEDPTSLGTYTCEAVNCMGRAYSSSKVHVIGRGNSDGSHRLNDGGVSPEPPPIFTKELEEKSIKICDPLTLSCHIVVPPWPRSVVWYNKEGKIEPSERYHVIEDGVGGYLLEVSSAEWRDEGEWKCVATSSGGRLGISTCYVTMDVPKNFRKPRFMENLQAVLTEEGLVSFECKVVGFPTPVLSWFKDGQELKPGDVYQLTGTNSLGSYCCIARNCMGQASSSADLTVEDIQNQLNEEEKLQLFSKNQAPKFLQGLKSVEAKIDEPFRFIVKVTIPPEPSVLWYRDDQPVDESSRCHLGKEERGEFFLDIQNLEFLDQAEWKCVAMNDFGHSVTSCFLKLLIPRHYKKPRFLENLQAILSDEGAVNLECKVIGVPQPILKWYKDGEELKPGDIHRIISGQDGTCCLGTYTCEAQNCMGIAASSASLLGFDDSVKTKNKKKSEEQILQRNLSLSTIHEERTSQMYDTPVGDMTLDDKGEISFSFDGKEVSVSLYETPDLTEEEALQIVEMYADQLSENITEHNVVELPPLRFVKETSTSGNLLMEAIIIDVSPEYFASPEEDLRTEADIEDISIADEYALLQLPLDHDLNISEDKAVPVMSDEKSNVHNKLNRKKSDSQKSGDDYFSLSREHSLSENKKEDDTQVMSESDLPSFASAHSYEKLKSKSAKMSAQDDHNSELEPSTENSEANMEAENKESSEKQSSRSDKPESIDESFKNKTNLKEKASRPENLKQHIVNINSVLNSVINDIQNLEQDVILKSELMSSTATASKSLEIIHSTLTPFSKIKRVIDAITDINTASNDTSSVLFSDMLKSLRSLQQSLTIVEKCIEVESNNRTLVKKTCVSLVEKCGPQIRNLLMLLETLLTEGCIKLEEKLLYDIQTIVNEINITISITLDTIKARNLLIEASELETVELSLEAKHLKDTQKAVYDMKRPLVALLNIVENAEKVRITDTVNVNNSSVILADMSGSIQDLQLALEQIELLSIGESLTPLNKYNTQIINSVMNTIHELRNSFEYLSTKSENVEDTSELKKKISSVEKNLNDIFKQLSIIEQNVGTYDILHNDNKLVALQTVAQILISLENNLPKLDLLPSIKQYMTNFHQQLTKGLEFVIESNEAVKYFNFIEICDTVKRINNSIQDIDTQTEFCLASINNTLNIIKELFMKKTFEIEFNKTIMISIQQLQISIQEMLNQANDLSFNFNSEYVHMFSKKIPCENKCTIAIECIDRTLAAIATVTSLQSCQEQEISILPKLESIYPILEELKYNLASLHQGEIQLEEHASAISDISSETAETIAKPICELNTSVSVLNELLLEHLDSIKSNEEQISTLAQPLNELHRTLEILQHDIISQLGDDLSPYVCDLNIAKTIQSLRSAIIMIYDNMGLEGVDELSTLEDITALKTTIDTVHSDHLVLADVKQNEICELSETLFEIESSPTIYLLQKLNNCMEILLDSGAREKVNDLCNTNSPPQTVSLIEHFTDLHAEITEAFHIPISASKLVAIANLMYALQQKLSIIDTTNIPISEHISEITSDSLHSVIEVISEVKIILDKSLKVMFPALELTDNTIEISKLISELKNSCLFLRNVLRMTNVKCIKDNIYLETFVNNFLKAVDVTQKINIKQIKKLSTEIFENIQNIENYILALALPPIEQKEQEADLIQSLNDIDLSIIKLEECDFLNLPEKWKLRTNTTPIESENRLKQISQLEEKLLIATEIIENCKEKLYDLNGIERLLKTCKIEIVILRSLLKRIITHKGILRLYQEIYFFDSIVSSLNSKLCNLNIPHTAKNNLVVFTQNSNNFVLDVKSYLLKTIESQLNLIFFNPLTVLKNNSEIMTDWLEINTSSDFVNLIQEFLKAKEIILPTFSGLDTFILEDLNLQVPINELNVSKDIATVEWISFINVVKRTLTLELPDVESKKQLEDLMHCIQQCEFDNTVGLAGQFILLKIISESSDILKQMILSRNEKYGTAVRKITSKTDIFKQLAVIDKEITTLRKNIFQDKDDTMSLDVKLAQSSMQNVNEIFNEILKCMETKIIEITLDDKQRSEINSEIGCVQNCLDILNNEEVSQTTKIDKFLNILTEIKESITTVLLCNITEHEQNIINDNLIKHVCQFLALNFDEIVKKLTNTEDITNIDKCIKKVKHFKEFVLDTIQNNINQHPEISRLTLFNKHNAGLVLELQQALSVMQSVMSENAEELSLLNKNVDLQRVNSIVTELTSDLKALSSSMDVLEQPPSEIHAQGDQVQAVPSSMITGELLPEKGGKEEQSLGELLQHIEEFVAQDCVKLVKEVPVLASAIDAEKCVKVATELKENIAALSQGAENEPAELAQLQTLNEQNAGLVLELQQALSVMQSVMSENAEELSLLDKNVDLQRVNSIVTELTSDLKALSSSMDVLEQPPSEIHAQGDQVQAVPSSMITGELLPEKGGREEQSLGELLQHIEEFVAQDCVKLVKEVPVLASAIDAEKCVKVATELKENIAALSQGAGNEPAELAQLQTLNEQNAGLVLELQQALSVMQSVMSENAEELSLLDKNVDLQRVNSIVTELTSDLKALSSSMDVLEQPPSEIHAQGDEVQAVPSSMITGELLPEKGGKEEQSLGELLQHIEEFVAQDCVKLVKEVPVLASAIDAEKCVKVATELKENIAALSQGAENEPAELAQLQTLNEHNAGLVLELQQALSVMQSVMSENAEELSLLNKNVDLQRVNSIVTELTSDLKALSSSMDVLEQPPSEIHAQGDEVQAVPSSMITGELLPEKGGKEEQSLGELLQHIEEFVAQDCVKLVKEVPVLASAIDAEKCVKVATELKENIAALSQGAGNEPAELAQLQTLNEQNAGLVLELQQALSVMQSVMSENAEELSLLDKNVDLQRVNSIVTELTSDLKALSSSMDVLEQPPSEIHAQGDQVQAVPSSMITGELLPEKGGKEDQSLGELLQHIEEFVAQDCVKLVKEVPVLASAIDAEKCVKVATELKENIAALSQGAENEPAELAQLQTLNEHNAGLVLELQQALSVMQSVMSENAEELSLLDKNVDLQRVNSIVTELTSDLKALSSSMDVLEQPPSEIHAQGDEVQAVPSSMITGELLPEKGGKEEQSLGELLQHIEEFVAQDCVKLMKEVPVLASAIDAEKCVKVATELKENIAALSQGAENEPAELAQLQTLNEHNAGLVLELQQALSVMQSVMSENAEELSLLNKNVDLQRVNSIVTELTSDLKALSSSMDVLEQPPSEIHAQGDEVQAVPSSMITGELLPEKGGKEEQSLGELLQHIEEFVAQDCVKLVKEVPVLASAIDAEKCVKVATELKENIAALSQGAGNEPAELAQLQTLNEQNAGLVLELQQALSVMQSVMSENAEELSLLDKNVDLQRVNSIVTELTSDLKALSSSMDVVEQPPSEIHAQGDQVQAVPSSMITGELLPEKGGKEDQSLGELLQHIEEFVAQDCVKLVKEVPVLASAIDAEKCVKVATELKENIAALSQGAGNEPAELAQLQTLNEQNAGLVLELQQALSVMQSVMSENAEELSLLNKNVDLQRVNSIVTELTSDLKALSSSMDVLEQPPSEIHAQGGQVQAVPSSMITGELLPEKGGKEDQSLGELLQHIEEFVAQDCVKLVKEVPVLASAIDAEKCVKVATELKENIAALSQGAGNEPAELAQLQTLNEQNAGLVLELQQALSVMQSVMSENAEELSLLNKNVDLQRVNSIVTELTSDLKALSSSMDVLEQPPSEIHAQGGQVQAVPSSMITGELLPEKGGKEEQSLGELLQHIEEFVAQDCVKLVKEVPVLASAIDAEKCVKVATELKENIAALSQGAENEPAELAQLQTLNEHNAGLVLELQQALSVMQSVMSENAEELSLLNKNVDLQRVNSIVTELTSDLKALSSSMNVLEQPPSEIHAQGDQVQAVPSSMITGELLPEKGGKEDQSLGELLQHIEEFVAQDCVKLVKEVPVLASAIDAEKCVKVATELKENIAALSQGAGNEPAELAQLQTLNEQNAGLVLELQQALSVMQSVMSENAEELSLLNKNVDLQRVNSIVTELTSDLKALSSSMNVLEQPPSEIHAQGDEVQAVPSSMITGELLPEKGGKEEQSLGELLQHIEEFVAQDCVKLVKEVPVLASAIDAEKCVKVATELKENIAALSQGAENEPAELAQLQTLNEHNVGLVLELQQALAVMQSVMSENAEELSLLNKNVDLQRVNSIVTELTSDLKALSSSMDVLEQPPSEIHAQGGQVQAVPSSMITGELLPEKGGKEDQSLGELLQHIEEFVAQDCVKLVKEVPVLASAIDAEKCVKVATELKENIAALSQGAGNEPAELAQLQTLNEQNAGLVLELQQALSVMQSVMSENAEELSLLNKNVDLQRVNSIVTELTSDLKALSSSMDVLEQPPSEIHAQGGQVQAVPSSMITGELLPEKGGKEEQSLGELLQHIEEFVAQDCVKLVKEVPVLASAIDAEKCVKVATELKENIAALSQGAENEPAELAQLQTLNEHNAGLVLELQQALSVMQSVMSENAEELSLLNKNVDLQRVNSIVTELTSDLKALSSSMNVLEQPPSEIHAQGDQVQAVPSSMITGELLPEKGGKEDQSLGELLQHIEEFVAQDCVKLVKEVPVLASAIDAEKCVKVATELKENIAALSQGAGNEPAELAQLQTLNEQNAGLVLELQQALSVMQSVMSENAEELSLLNKNVDLQRVNSIVTELTSDLKALSSSMNVLEQPPSEIHAQGDEVQAVPSSMITGELLPEKGGKEEQSLGELLQHIEEFVAQDCVKLVKEVPVLASAIDAEKCVKVATELKENIAALSQGAENEPAELAQLQTLNEHNVGLVLELQQALAVMQSVMSENAEELSLLNKNVDLQRVNSIVTELTSDLKALSSSMDVLEQPPSEIHAQGGQVQAVPSSMITGELLPEKGGKEEQSLGELLQHIEQFVSEDCVNLVNELPALPYAIDATKCVKVATELKENIAALLHDVENESADLSRLQSLNEHNASLALELQEAVFIMQALISENAEEVSLQNEGVDFQHVKSTVTMDLSPNLKALYSSVNVMQQSSCEKNAEDDHFTYIPSSQTMTEEIAEDHYIESESREDSLQRLKDLLQEVWNKIDVSATVKTSDDFEILQTTLDEMQAVIIELKRDYDRSLNDTLSEVLEDLECGIRSVQLQINEDSPKDLLKEACTSLHVLINNMCEIQEFQVFQTMLSEVKLENIIHKCATNSEDTINFLDSSFNIKTIDKYETDTLLSDVSFLKNVIKSLKSCFEECAEILIEKGIEIMESLDQVEDRAFALEKNVDNIKNISSAQKDSMVTAVHSTYGTISNMRSTMASVQKQYMFETYGKSSELMLKAIKNVFLLANECDKKWIKLAKSLRKVLNHFEDIKFYVNFDKTARLPSDATFMTIILFDLKTVIDELFSSNESQFCEEIITHIEVIKECLDFNLHKIESHPSLDVKDKIPIFKAISLQMYNLTKSIKENLINTENNSNVINKKKLLPETKNQIDYENVKHLQNEFTENEGNIIQKISKNNENFADLEGKIGNRDNNIEICVSSFDLERIPETIMTMKVPEMSVLKMCDSKPLEAIVLQTIDTGILFEAKVTEVVTEKHVNMNDSKDGENLAINLSKDCKVEVNIEAEPSSITHIEHLSIKNDDSIIITENTTSALNLDSEYLHLQKDDTKNDTKSDKKKRSTSIKTQHEENDTNVETETGKLSSKELSSVKKADTHENNHLNEFKRPSFPDVDNFKDILSVSEIRCIDSKTGNENSSNHYLQPDKISDNTAKSISTNKPLFLEKINNDYDNEFLKPPGYIGKTYSNDHPVLEIDEAPSCSFYKTQTRVCNTEYQSVISPERYSDGYVNRRACNEDRNHTAEKRSHVFRDFKRKPVFSTHLTDRTAVEGSRVKLTCSIITSTEPKIFWYKNGVLLNNKLKYKTKVLDGILTMEVLNAVPSDSAEYSCTVETENGSVSTAAKLKVYPSFEASPIPPTFTRSIRDTYHLAENELVLECRIRGQPLPTITWLKDDRPVESNERYQAYYLADGVCRLAISCPTIEDSGKFTCHAENSIWSDQISHVVAFTGKNIPHLTSAERSQLNRQLLETRRLHFTNVLSDYKVAKGGTIGLQVEIKGSPTRVEWLREGHSITDSYKNAQTFVDHSLYTLALSDVTEMESGIYTFRAWSNHGNVDMNAAITVIQPNEIDGKPAIIIGRPQKDMLISVGEDLNISFRVRGEPKPKVAFMKGIRDITNSQRVCKMTSNDYIKFTLKRSVVSDAGTYCILARNAYGCDRAFVTVMIRQRASSENLISDWTYPIDDSVIAIPERKYKSVPNRIPGEPSVVDGGNNWISIAWSKADSESGAPVLAYKVESWLLGKDGGARWIELGITPLNNFDAFNLKQGEEYHFRVTPRNRYGWGESVQTSTPIGIGLAGDRPEFIDILPGQLKVLVGGTATLNCSFKGKPIPEIVWMKNGHEIDEENKRLRTFLNENNCCLTINDVCIEDEARYSCEATNIHGRASTYARVAVVTDRLIWEADAKLKRERSADGGECPPQFTMRLRDRRVQATYPVRLTCQVIGRPSPIVTWYKSGVEVIDNNRHAKSQDELFHTLEIAPTKLEDGGVYEVTARNNSGAISCRCNLVVDKGIRAYVAPEFCCGLQPLYQLTIGDELRISAVVEAYPSVGVSWYRDGVRLRPNRRAVMTLDHDGQIELAVASVTRRDAGVYTCTASNEVGKASTSGKVEVIGDSADEKKQTLPTLICPDVPYSKEPAFIRKPRSSEAREGDTVIIECEVIGDPKPEVYWLRDFLKPDYYRDASHFRRVGDGPEYRFEIPHAKLDYTGAYSVVAKNVHGEAKAVISLQILAKDPFSSDDSHSVRYGRVEVIPRFEKELTDLLSHDGDAVEFQCQVTGNPEPDIKWYHYNEIIRESEEFETSFELGAARLKIKQVTADDEGTYTCEARNNLGKATSNACLVVYPAGEPNTLSQRLRRPPALLSAVSTPRSTPARSLSRTRTPVPDMRSLCSPSRDIAPKFYTYPFNKVAEEGDTVVFQCAVKGLPAPWATWDKDGVIITPTSRITIKEKDELLRILEIEEVSSEDVGLYRITLENDYGRAEASARLEVISQKGKFYTGGRSYSASPKKSLPYRRSKYSLPRQD